MPEEEEIKLYKKFTVIRNSTGITETEEYVSLRLSKKIDLDFLIDELEEIFGNSTLSEDFTWKDIEKILLKSEMD